MTSKPYRLQDMLKQIEKLVTKHKIGSGTPGVQSRMPRPEIDKQIE